MDGPPNSLAPATAACSNAGFKGPVFPENAFPWADIAADNADKWFEWRYGFECRAAAKCGISGFGYPPRPAKLLGCIGIGEVMVDDVIARGEDWVGLFTFLFEFLSETPFAMGDFMLSLVKSESRVDEVTSGDFLLSGDVEESDKKLDLTDSSRR